MTDANDDPVTPDDELTERARALLIGMTERERWVYALPRGETFAAAAAQIEGDGFVARGERAEGEGTDAVRRYADPAGETRFVLCDVESLDVIFVEAEGEGAIPSMQALLEKSGFVAQSKLWAEARDLTSEQATGALLVLAPMAVADDEAWLALLGEHLASPDEAVRRGACDAALQGALAAREVAPTVALLDEARQAEQAPEIAAALGEALDRLAELAEASLDLAEIQALTA